MSGALLDNSDQLDNEKYLEYATFRGRFLATFIDVILVGALKIGLLILNLFFLQNMIVQYLKAIIYPFYKIYLEGVHGQTLGKKWLGIRVVKLNDRNDNMDLKSSIIRYSFYLPYFFLELLVIYYTFDLSVLVKTDFEKIVMTYQQFRHNEPPFLLSLKIWVGLIIVVSVLFIFEGKKRQALHDRISKTVCVNVKKKI